VTALYAVVNYSYVKRASLPFPLSLRFHRCFLNVARPPTKGIASRAFLLIPLLCWGFLEKTSIIYSAPLFILSIASFLFFFLWIFFLGARRPTFFGSLWDPQALVPTPYTTWSSSSYMGTYPYSSPELIQSLTAWTSSLPASAFVCNRCGFVTFPSVPLPGFSHSCIEPS